MVSRAVQTCVAVLFVVAGSKKPGFSVEELNGTVGRYRRMNQRGHLDKSSFFCYKGDVGAVLSHLFSCQLPNYRGRSFS